MIVCAAIIGPSNNPLYLEVFNADDLEHEEILKFHSICHCALDSVEEALALTSKSSAAKGSGTEGGGDAAYLGLLYPTEEFKVYGYVSNTGVKFLLVLDDPLVKDEDVKGRLEGMHTAYVDAVSNPFYTFSQPIASPKFEARLRVVLKVQRQLG